MIEKRRLKLFAIAILVVLGGCLSAIFRNPVVAQVTQPAEEAVNYSGPLKIVKLLWSANPKNAASTLRRSILTAVERNSVQELRDAMAKQLQPQVVEVFSQADVDDPRFAVAVAATLITSDHIAAKAFNDALEALTSLEDRELVWRVWLSADPPAARDFLAATLDRALLERDSNWLGVLIREALTSNPQLMAAPILERWAQLDVTQRLAAIEPLTANADSMARLLDAIAAGQVAKDLVNTNQLRKWMATENVALKIRIESLWGKVRMSDNAERQRLVAETLSKINAGATGSAAAGAEVFKRVCSQCHVLHGQGFEVGPNIVGNGRGSLQQLVSNILDPSLVIGEAFQAKTVLTIDGEVTTGLVAGESDRYLRLKIQGGKIIEFDKDEIELIKASTQSLMPEGLEAQLKPQELYDLLAYLCLLSPPEAEPNELIPGVPETFVQP